MSAEENSNASRHLSTIIVVVCRDLTGAVFGGGSGEKVEADDVDVVGCCCCCLQG